MVDRRNIAIILEHPTFNDPETGRAAAKEYANVLIEHLKASTHQLEADGAPPEQVQQMAAEISKFKVKVRLIPETF